MKMLAVLAILPLSLFSLAAQEHHHHPTGPAALPADSAQPIDIPDVELVNQRGERVHFYTDLVKGKAVAIQTIFTTCTTICPPMGATWGRVEDLLRESDPANYRLISISIDPQVDTPPRLTQWAAQFHAGPQWTLLTGPQPEIDRLLKALKLYTADKFSHTPLAMVGSESGWQYLDVLRSQAPAIADSLRKSMAEVAAHRYFTDVPLIDQTGKQVRLYSDVMKDHTVVIDQFFTSCKDSCPMMAAKFSRLQEWLGPRLGNDVFLVSISVDPETDTPEKLRAYAQRFKARPGWIFLTGTKQNVDLALGRLGTKINLPNDHTTVFLIGNLRTGLWKKAMGTAGVEELTPVLQSVIDDGK